MATSKRARWISNPLILTLPIIFLFTLSSCNSVPALTNPVEEGISISTPAATQTIAPLLTQTIAISSSTESATQRPEIVPTSTPTEILTIEKENQFIPLFGFPIAPPGSNLIETSYRFGSTQSGDRIPHDGVEMVNPEGTQVVAVSDGLVYFSGDDRSIQRGRFLDFYGDLIILEHHFENYSKPIYTLYAHLSQIIVKEGESVSKGQEIGLVGASGAAFTNHLHFEVRVGNPFLENARNPELFLPLNPPEKQSEVGILIGSLRDQVGDLLPGVSVVIQNVQNGELILDNPIYVESYAQSISGDENWNENFVVSNLQVGNYRVSAYANQYLLEEFITIKPNEYSIVNLEPDE